MKDNFNRYRILSWHFFSYSTLNMSSYYLLASIVSAENLAIDLIEVSFYVMIHCFLLFSGFSLSFSCLMCLSVDYLHLSFLELIELLGCVASCLLSNFGCFLPLFLQIFFLSLSSLSVTLIMSVFMNLMVSRRSLGLFSFSSFFFLLLRLDNFSWPVFKFSDSYVCSNVLLIPSCEFFISVIVFFSPRISVWFLFIIFVSIDILFCWDFFFCLFF